MRGGGEDARGRLDLMGSESGSEGKMGLFHGLGLTFNPVHGITSKQSHLPLHMLFQRRLARRQLLLHRSIRRRQHRLHAPPYTPSLREHLAALHAHATGLDVPSFEQLAISGMARHQHMASACHQHLQSLAKGFNTPQALQSTPCQARNPGLQAAQLGGKHT